MVGAIHIWRDGETQRLEPDGDLAQTLRSADVQADDLIRHDGQWMHASAVLADLPAPPAPRVATPWLSLVAMATALMVIVAGMVISWPTSGAPPVATQWHAPTPIPMPAQPPPPAPPPLAARPCTGLDAACALHTQHADWSLPVCTAIVENRVILGMQPAQVLQSWGKPTRKEEQRWCYEADCASGVRWQSDRVVDIFGP